MPFKSESQRRYFHVMEDKGEISPKVVHEWEHATPKKKKENLPYHVKKSSPFFSSFVDVMEKISVSNVAIYRAAKNTFSKLPDYEARMARSQRSEKRLSKIPWRQMWGSGGRQVKGLVAAARNASIRSQP